MCAGEILGPLPVSFTSYIVPAKSLSAAETAAAGEKKVEDGNTVDKTTVYIALWLTIVRDAPVPRAYWNSWTLTWKQKEKQRR